MSPRSSSLALVLAAMWASVPAHGEEGFIARPELLARGRQPDLASPVRLRAGEGRLSAPLWTHQGLWVSAPRGLPALRHLVQVGPPAYDPQTRAYYAAAEGTIVEVRADQSLRVIVDGVQGSDIDVRAGSGVAVSREPDHSIVLHRWRGGSQRHMVLLRGERFFAPRFSADGTRLLVSESRARGGHIWLVELDGKASDLGQGYDAAWHPDGRRIVFSRITHDRYRVTDGDLWTIELASRRERSLGRTPGLIELEPQISPDGRWLAFQDGRKGDLYLARFPSPAGR